MIWVVEAEKDNRCGVGKHVQAWQSNARIFSVTFQLLRSHVVSAEDTNVSRSYCHIFSSFRVIHSVMHRV